MHLTTQEVAVQNLKLGMYVSRLDVPWVQTPFPIQGFYLTTEDELNQLSHYCNKVYVDLFLSKDEIKPSLRPKLATSKKNDKTEIDPNTIRLMKEKARFKPRAENYIVTGKLNKEMKAAEQLYQQISSQMAIIYRELKHSGYINFNEVRAAAGAMTKSIISNPNAMAWLCRVNNDNRILHQQSVRSSVWALIFARHMGLSKEDLRDLGTALLLSSIGKSKLPESLLLEKQSSEGILQYQEHINLTLEETEKMFSTSHQVNYILSNYCERNNGTGFPNKLVGNRIPFLARIAGLANYYEQLINPYNKIEALSPADAISHLYSIRGDLFQSELIEEFIQSIGIYPTGSLVQLSDKSVGVVIEQLEKSRLRPRVAIFKNKQESLLEKAVTINLSKKSNDQNECPLNIEKSMISASEDIDAHDLHHKVFGQKGWFSFLAN
jgi:HD-GYP domain-containing protein (c-di-GMP phosphodiesterase class II)